MQPAIILRNVTKRFGATAAVDNLSLEVPSGSIYGFIGPNGSGKTTTLRMIMHILLPDEGEIEVLGSRDTAAARDQVSYLPEERGLYKKMTVRRLLRYYGRLKGRPRRKSTPASPTGSTRMELPGVLDKPIEAMSKGMSQKVQFISAVISKPSLLILDEPFSGLDPVNAQVLKDAVLEMKQRGTTVVFSTHDMSTAEKMCDRIFMIFRGKKVLDGTLTTSRSNTAPTPSASGPRLGCRRSVGCRSVDAVNDFGQMQEVRLKGTPQDFLTQLARGPRVYHFEITRPSLQDIFVRIARPELTGQELAGTAAT